MPSSTFFIFTSSHFLYLTYHLFSKRLKRKLNSGICNAQSTKENIKITLRCSDPIGLDTFNSLEFYSRPNQKYPNWMKWLLWTLVLKFIKLPLLLGALVGGSGTFFVLSSCFLLWNSSITVGKKFRERWTWWFIQVENLNVLCTSLRSTLGTRVDDEDEKTCPVEDKVTGRWPTSISSSKNRRVGCKLIKENQNPQICKIINKNFSKYELINGTEFHSIKI